MRSQNIEKYERRYRFTFNGKESDSEWHNTSGSIYDYGFRIYNPRIGKFLSVDPLTKGYPMLTPYQFASNTPIQAIDIDGLEAYKQTTYDEATGKTKITITIDVQVKNSSSLISDIEAISYAHIISKQVVSTFSGDVDENTTTDVNVNIINLGTNEGKIALNQVNLEDAFYIDFVDQVEGEAIPENAVGRTTEIGNPTNNRFQVRVASVSDNTLKRSNKAIGRTGTHELGHGFGLRHPWSPFNDVSDVDQQGKDNNYEPSQGVANSTIKNNIMNSGSNKNESLKPSSPRANKSTQGQRKKIVEVIPEKDN